MDPSAKDIAPSSQSQDAAAAVPVVLILVGVPGSGKSTFCQKLMANAASPWCRINQARLYFKQNALP